jgi:hypothetical protein
VCADSDEEPRAMFPLWLKLSYTAFVAVLVPAYLYQYGAGNFLWFSDVALFLGLAAMWLEHRLLASTQAIAVVVPESFWIVEFLLRVTTGIRLAGLTDYMFDASIPGFVRALSLFHIWLPVVLVFMVLRLGYDRRALGVQIVIGTVVLGTTYLLTGPEDNVNWVHRWGGLSGPWALMLSTIAFPLVFYGPAHFALRRCARPSPGH